MSAYLLRMLANVLLILGLQLLYWALIGCPLCWLERKLRPRPKRKGRGL